MLLHPWIWRGISALLPSEWELLLFSKRAEAGSITFADRYQYRLQIAWRVLTGEPDMKRTVSDSISKLREQSPDVKVSKSKHGPWSGFSFAVNNRSTSRHLRFFPDEKLLLEVIRPPMEVAGEEMDDHELLKGIDLVKDSDRGRWIAFGMDCRVPDTFALTECEVRPGFSRMTFSGPGKQASRIAFSRRGMLKHWLKGEVSDWLTLQAPDQLTDPQAETEEKTGHLIHRFGGSFRKRESGDWRKRRRFYQSAAWICPRDGRLYQQEKVSPSPQKQFLNADRDFSLSCCDLNPHAFAHV
jgi:hypothetical protein